MIVKEGIYGNGLLLTDFESLNGSVQADVQAGDSVVMESIDCSLSVDNDATTRMLSTGASQFQALNDLQNYHSTATNDIQTQADHCFNQEYLEDKPTCTTPRKRSIDIPSKASIETLRAPSIDNLVQEFRDNNNSSLMSEKGIPNQRGIAVKESKIPIFAESSLLKDNRVPLTTVN